MSWYVLMPSYWPFPLLTIFLLGGTTRAGTFPLWNEIQMLPMRIESQFTILEKKKIQTEKAGRIKHPRFIEAHHFRCGNGGKRFPPRWPEDNNSQGCTPPLSLYS